MGDGTFGDRGFSPDSSLVVTPPGSDSQSQRERDNRQGLIHDCTFEERLLEG